MGSGVRLSRFNLGCGIYSMLGFSQSNCIFLCLSFLTCKMGIMLELIYQEG